MLTYLGNLAIGQVVPLFGSTLGTTVATLVRQLAGLRADVAALESDGAALMSDAVTLLADVASAQAFADGILAQIARGPAVVVDAIQAAIARILDGSALAALQASVLTAPTQILASWHAAVDASVAKAASIQARIAGLEARIAELVARGADLLARIDALTSLKSVLDGAQALLATAGLHVYRYTGTVGGLGSELSGALAGGVPGGSGGGDSADALVLVTTIGATLTALGQVFRIV